MCCKENNLQVFFFSKYFLNKKKKVYKGKNVFLGFEILKKNVQNAQNIFWHGNVTTALVFWWKTLEFNFPAAKRFSDEFSNVGTRLPHRTVESCGWFEAFFTRSRLLFLQGEFRVRCSEQLFQHENSSRLKWSFILVFDVNLFIVM